jgi:hypothetical protein
MHHSHRNFGSSSSSGWWHALGSFGLLGLPIVTSCVPNNSFKADASGAAQLQH